MSDRTFEDKNNQKKTLSVFASGVIDTSATQDDILFTLPKASMITAAYVVVLTASGTATDTVDLKLGATVIADEVVVGTLGTKDAGITPTYYENGGIISVVAGADAPDDAGKYKVIVEYTETELTNGEYTV